MNIKQQKHPLPIGLNRISWKVFFTLRMQIQHPFTLPIGLNRISWKDEGQQKRLKHHQPYRLG